MTGYSEELRSHTRGGWIKSSNPIKEGGAAHNLEEGVAVEEGQGALGEGAWMRDGEARPNGGCR